MKKRVVMGLLAASLLTVCVAPITNPAAVYAEEENTEGENTEAETSEEETTEAENSEGENAGTEAAEEDSQGNQYFQCLNAEEVNIKDTSSYTIKLKAKEGWQFDVADNTDVTNWLVNAEGEPVFTNDSGIAFAVNGDDFELDITLDASKIEGFATNGSGDLYVMPNGGIPLVVEGENHGQYVQVSEKAGSYTIPEVAIEGTIEATSEKGENTYTNDTVTVALKLDGVDDTLIDSSASYVTMRDGDGYYLTDFTFEDGSLTGEWSGGEMAYTIAPEQLQGDFSPLGGDGNGNYYINIGVGGLTYNGLPLSEKTFRIHVYSFGRTFTIESNGSLINDTQPLWSNDTEGGEPILCDAYPDDLNIKWPVDFDASGLSQDDFALTLKSDYGDELTLEAGKDFTVKTEKDKTTITVNYIYWANIPVYKTMSVDVKTENLTWDSQKYTVGDQISHDYDIASVYAYYIMSGGMEGTQKWTYYGVDNLTDWAQAFKIPTYTLTYTDENGAVKYYAEDENGTGKFTDAADEAKEFDSREDNQCQIVDNTGSFARVYDQTADVEVDGTTYTCDKVYSNADNMPLDPKDCTDITAQPGYVIGDTWEMHGRWPWQTFVNEGYLGGSK